MENFQKISEEEKLQRKKNPDNQEFYVLVNYHSRVRVKQKNFQKHKKSLH